MLFSILIANYNNGHFFRDCYESIIAQTYTNWEVILVDDGSTDESIQIIKDIIGEDKRFKFYENASNKGCGYTKARCAELAGGDILGFVDPDDAIKENALSLMVEIYVNNPKVAIVTSNYEMVDLQLNFMYNGKHASRIPKNYSYLTYGRGALTAFATFNNNAYKKSGGIDKKMKRAVDQDLYYKMEEQGAHLFLDKVLYKYRVHKNSISQNDNLWKAEYWHFYAIVNAYIRRKKNKIQIDNFSKDYIKNYQVDYYLMRFEKLKFSEKKEAKFYFLYKSFFKDLFYKFQFKVKSLVLTLIGKI